MSSGPAETYTALPSIDACHAELAALSCKALDRVAAHDPAPAAKKFSKKSRKVKRERTAAGDSPPELLKRAHRSLAECDFAGAGELLCSIRISDRDELVFLELAARTLVEEIGAYQQAIELLLAHQNQFLRVSGLRVLLARAYYLSGALPEARAIFDGMHQGELDITGELSTLLQWEQAETPAPEKEKRSPDWQEKLFHQIYFGFKGEEKPEDPPSGE
jgi:hypothetical protein